MIVDWSFDDYRDNVLKHLQALIRIRSVKSEPQPGQPFGEGIDQALQYMLELGRSLGFRVKNVDGYAGHVEYGEGDGLIGILVHLDTVPEGEGWTVPPFGAEVRDGMVFGRGASDNKGPAVATMFALKALKDAGIKLNKRVRIVFGTNEEHGMSDMDYYFSKEPLPDEGFSPDAVYPVINAEKGILFLELSQAASSEEIVVSYTGGSAPNVVPERCECILQDGTNWTTVGVPAHGSVPERGENAIAAMNAKLMSELGDEAVNRFIHFFVKYIGMETDGTSLGIRCSDEVSGALTVNHGTMRLDNGMFRASLDIRYPVTSDGEVILAAITAKAADVGISVHVNTHLLPLYLPEDAPLIVKLRRAYETVTGEHAELLSMGGGTYARTLRNRGVTFGANFQGIDTRAHQSDEFMRIDDLMRHGQICMQAIYELTRDDG